ncbi:hypothetical protein C8J56DRAFT_1066739 [Mycena floridula]|nr:hypothetical protein C8J56DRAFT_1066739 [Mycena floridula]
MSPSRIIKSHTVLPVADGQGRLPVNPSNGTIRTPERKRAHFLPPTPTSLGKAETTTATRITDKKTSGAAQTLSFEHSHKQTKSVRLPRVRFHDELPIRISYKPDPSSFLALSLDEGCKRGDGESPHPAFSESAANVWLTLMATLCALAREAHAGRLRVVKHGSVDKITTGMHPAVTPSLKTVLLSWDNRRVERFRCEIESVKRLTLGGMIVFEPRSDLVQEALWLTSALVDEAVEESKKDEEAVELMLLDGILPFTHQRSKRSLMTTLDRAPKARRLVMDCVLIHQKTPFKNRSTKSNTKPDPMKHHLRNTEFASHILTPNRAPFVASAVRSLLPYVGSDATIDFARRPVDDLRTQLKDCFECMHQVVRSPTEHWDKLIIEKLDPSMVDEESLLNMVHEYTEVGGQPARTRIQRLLGSVADLADREDVDDRIRRLISILRAGIDGTNGLIMWKSC